MDQEQVVQPVYYLDGSPAPAGVPPSPVVAQPGPGGSVGAFGTTQPTGGTAFTESLSPQTIDQFTLQQIVEIFVVYAFIAAFGLAFFFVFYGGLSFILSGGNDEKIKQAVNTIRYSIIGLVVIILSFSFVAIVGRLFGLDVISYLSLNKIRESIRILIPQTAMNEAPAGLEWPEGKV